MKVGEVMLLELENEWKVVDVWELSWKEKKWKEREKNEVAFLVCVEKERKKKHGERKEKKKKKKKEQRAEKKRKKYIKRAHEKNIRKVLEYVLDVIYIIWWVWVELLIYDGVED